MSNRLNLKILLTAILFLIAFCMYNPIGASANLIDVDIDGMSGFQISGDDKVWLDIKNENIFGQTYPVMEAWAIANDWRFATHDEFIQLLGDIVPTYLYSSPTYDDGHFTEDEAIIMGANDMPGAPAGEIEYFSAFIDEDYDQRHVGVFYEDDGEGNFYHSWWGVTDNDTLGDIIYYGYESALLIKEDGAQPPPIPEPGTLMLIGSGLIGLIGLRRKFKKS